MKKIAFVTDSTTSLPATYVQEYNIHVVPNIMIWSGQEYQDGVDIAPAEFYPRLQSARELPTTAAVPPFAFETLFKALLADNYDILGIFMSTTMSRTCHSAQQAKETLGAENIVVIDSQTGGMAAGWPLLHAARAAAAGATLAQCTAIAHEGLANTGFIGTLDTLEFLQRSGRIGLVQRYVGSLLRMKPLLEMVDGQFVPAGRVRTRRKALAQMVEMTVARINGRAPLHLAILHGDAAADAQTLLTMLQERLTMDEAVIGDISANVAVNLGPGTLGVNFMAGVS